MKPYSLIANPSLSKAPVFGLSQNSVRASVVGLERRLSWL